MRCPKCASVDDKVVDSRVVNDGKMIRRRRECLKCGHRFTTTEVLLREGLVVVKRDGRREDFDPEKLMRAIRAATSKRPIEGERIEMLVDEVTDELEANYEGEIPSSAIGDAIMPRLRRIDEVAYVRFASVYKEFRDVTEFMQEIMNTLGKQMPPGKKHSKQ